MRTKLAKTVRGEFGKLMAQKFPSFERITANDVVSTGNSLYRWKIGENIYAFIMVQLHRRKDAFTINVAISQDEHCGTPRANLTLASGSGFVRIQKLWEQTEDFWFMLPDDLERVRRAGVRSAGARRMVTFLAPKKEPTDEEIAVVKGFVNDAIGLIHKYAIPRFKTRVP